MVARPDLANQAAAAIRMVASTADDWDERFKQIFGGFTYQQIAAGDASASPPKLKPGQGQGPGTGFYL